MNEEVSQYIATAPEAQRLIMEQIRAMIHKEVPGVEEHIKWGRPVFSKTSDFAYFKTAKTYLSFGFFKSGLIKDHTELLEGSGKDMRHIKISKAAELPAAILRKWIRQVAQ